MSAKVNQLKPGQSLLIFCSHSKGSSRDTKEDNRADNVHIIYMELRVH